VSTLGRRQRLGLAVGLLAFLLLALAYVPTLRWLWTTWLGDPYYSHGLLLPLVSLFLVWRRETTQPVGPGLDCDLPPVVWIAGLALLAACYGLNLLALRSVLYPASALCLLVSMAALALPLQGGSGLRRHAFALALLLLAIPIPQLERWTPVLARSVAGIAAESASLLGLDVAREGARLMLPSVELVIGAPCSGINSLLAMLSLGAVNAHLMSGPWPRRLALVICAIPIALLSNYLRVMLLLLTAATLGMGRTLTILHDLSGVVLFVLSAALLVVVGRALRCGSVRAI